MKRGRREKRRGGPDLSNMTKGPKASLSLVSLEPPEPTLSFDWWPVSPLTLAINARALWSLSELQLHQCRVIS